MKFSNDSSATGRTDNGIRALFGGVSALLRNRIALLSLELQEQKNNLLHSVIVLALASFLLIVGLVSGMILLALLVPAELRISLFAILMAIFLLLGFFALLHLYRRFKSQPLPFVAPLLEIKKDLDALKKRV